jgi:uncharacterized protein with ParB-like and HNH nuclease domain
MEAAPVNIIQYFDGSKQGVIPLFQRPYSWEQKDWSALWEDLMAQYETTDRSTHFMGAVVTVPVKSVPVGVTKHLVIDGQQRLTTLSLLLAAIRDKADQESDGATVGIIGDFLINRHYKAPDDLKLVPTQADRSAYNAVVYQKDIAAHDESRIVQAYRYFRNKLEGKDPEDEPITAAQTLQAIQQSLQVVMINLSETDDPYLIFESLNHKGKPLNQADLVRNYVLMRFQHSTSTGGEQEIAYEDLWRPMETRLDGVMPEFLRHFGMRGGRNVRKGDIYTASKLELEKFKTPAEVKSGLAGMKAAAFYYQKFLHPEEEPDIKIGQRLKGILELDSTVFYPLLIRLYISRDRDQIGADDLLRCLDLLETFYVRRMVCGVPTNALNKITLELCLNLPDSGLEAWLRERLTQGSGSRRCPSDQEFFDALVVQRIYPRRKIARYMLIALEDAHQHKEPVDTTSATMEHVMPQTLTDAWRTSLGENYAETHDRWLDTLGNLTLTGYNSELGNATFEDKKLKLQNTHFELSRSLLSQAQWNYTEIEERGKNLAEIAKKRWSMQ